MDEQNNEPIEVTEPTGEAPLESSADTSSNSKWGLAVLAAALVLAAGAIGWSVWQGQDDEPQVAEVVEEEGPVPIGVLRDRAEADPLDSAAWQELGFAHYQRQEYSEASQAYRQAIEGDKTSAVLWSALGEARIMASDRDPMPAEAVAAFNEALKLDPSDARSRYFLATKKDLDGDPDGAIADWLALLEDTPPGAPWEATLRQTIEQVGKIDKIETSTRLAQAETKRPGSELTAGNAIPGPSTEQISAASAIPPGEQRDMAEGMVERLETRLNGAPQNVDGWVMLMRSRITLGQPDKASKALKDAIAANPGDADRLRREAEIMGVE